MTYGRVDQRLLLQGMRETLEDAALKVPLTLDEKNVRVRGIGLVLAKARTFERRRAKILDKLDKYIDQEPEEGIKHGDIARYMRLQAELEGMIRLVKEEKHLHIHKENIDSLNEDQLRKRLEEIQNDKKSSEGVRGIDVVEAIIVE